jgi:hypothetical protein
VAAAAAQEAAAAAPDEGSSGNKVFYYNGGSNNKVFYRKKSSTTTAAAVPQAGKPRWDCLGRTRRCWPAHRSRRQSGSGNREKVQQDHLDAQCDGDGEVGSGSGSSHLQNRVNLHVYISEMLKTYVHTYTAPSREAAAVGPIVPRRQ